MDGTGPVGGHPPFGGWLTGGRKLMLPEAGPLQGSSPAVAAEVSARRVPAFIVGVCDRLAM